MAITLKKRWVLWRCAGGGWETNIQQTVAKRSDFHSCALCPSGNPPSSYLKCTEDTSSRGVPAMSTVLLVVIGITICDHPKHCLLLRDQAAELPLCPLDLQIHFWMKFTNDWMVCTTYDVLPLMCFLFPRSVWGYICCGRGSRVPLQWLSQCPGHYKVGKQWEW